MRQIISTLIELTGAAAVVHGCYLIAPFLGFVVAGVVLVAVGLALDPPQKADE
jgi:hypothetical protein